ncbi:uncharacterized protein LOC128881866 [Hylaeus volcanicus]|uniref:uncharacterized protein LOC128881866 n=1 Tax=Hylaeus volcanicus TaxID=313075 RepID=UPI0023B7A048|nr:uncharacterized protein LOC128881866 [Hylaeus volcanicus]
MAPPPPHFTLGMPQPPPPPPLFVVGIPQAPPPPPTFVAAMEQPQRKNVSNRRRRQRQNRRRRKTAGRDVLLTRPPPARTQQERRQGPAVQRRVASQLVHLLVINKRTFVTRYLRNRDIIPHRSTAHGGRLAFVKSPLGRPDPAIKQSHSKVRRTIYRKRFVKDVDPDKYKVFTIFFNYYK